MDGWMGGLGFVRKNESGFPGSSGMVGYQGGNRAGERGVSRTAMARRLKAAGSGSERAKEDGVEAGDVGLGAEAALGRIRKAATACLSSLSSLRLSLLLVQRTTLSLPEHATSCRQIWPLGLKWPLCPTTPTGSSSTTAASSTTTTTIPTPPSSSPCRPIRQHRTPSPLARWPPRLRDRQP